MARQASPFRFVSMERCTRLHSLASGAVLGGRLRCRRIRNGRGDRLLHSFSLPHASLTTAAQSGGSHLVEHEGGSGEQQLAGGALLLCWQLRLLGGLTALPVVVALAAVAWLRRVTRLREEVRGQNLAALPALPPGFRHHCLANGCGSPAVPRKAATGQPMLCLILIVQP